MPTSKGGSNDEDVSNQLCSSYCDRCSIVLFAAVDRHGHGFGDVWPGCPPLR